LECQLVRHNGLCQNEGQKETLIEKVVREDEHSRAAPDAAPCLPEMPASRHLRPEPSDVLDQNVAIVDLSAVSAPSKDGSHRNDPAVSDTRSRDIHHGIADAEHLPGNALAKPQNLTSKSIPKVQADAPTKPYELPEKGDRLTNQTRSPACAAPIVPTVVEGSANVEKVVSARSHSQAELEVGNSPVDHVAQATALEYSGSHPVGDVTDVQPGVVSKSNQKKAPPTEDDKRHNAAVEELERREKDYCDARKQFDHHQVTYASQLLQYFQDHPQDNDDMRDEAFGPIYLDRGKTISGKLSAAEAALKAVRIAAKEAGVEDVNFWDQESGFHSVTGEGLGPADHQFLLDTCPRKRVRQWIQRPEKTSKHQNTELQYAVSSAEIDPWESASCRGESSKRKKIDAED
jgi:hypothetical protein